MTAAFSAVCRSGYMVNFTNTNSDHVNYRLPVKYEGDDTSECVFNKRADSEVYVILVKASLGEENGKIHDYAREFQITCTFDKKGKDDSPTQSLKEYFIAPKAVQKFVGPDTSSTIDLSVVDVLGDLVTFMPHGRMVQLKAESDGNGGEQGLRVVGCDAVGTSTSTRYSLIRAGCGDGMIFTKTEGFTTSGLVSTSPYFKAFSLTHDEMVRFECNFTTCASTCEGSSCLTEKRRRRGIHLTGSYPNIYTVSTLQYHVT